MVEEDIWLYVNPTGRDLYRPKPPFVNVLKWVEWDGLMAEGRPSPGTKPISEMYIPSNGTGRRGGTAQYYSRRLTFILHSSLVYTPYRS